MFPDNFLQKAAAKKLGKDDKSAPEGKPKGGVVIDIALGKPKPPKNFAAKGATAMERFIDSRNTGKKPEPDEMEGTDAMMGGGEPEGSEDARLFLQDLIDQHGPDKQFSLKELLDMLGGGEGDETAPEESVEGQAA